MPEHHNTRPAPAWIFYDDRRRLLRVVVRVLAGPLVRRGFRPAPLRRGWAQDRLDLPATAPGCGVHVLTPTGRALRGAAALGYVLRRFRRRRVTSNPKLSP